MDKLEKIFEMQALLNQDITERRALDKSSTEEWIQRNVLAMVSELAEVLDEVNFKWWKNPRPLDEHALKQELVDVLHFFVSMCQTAGMDADELFAMYMEKNRENFDRQNGTSSKKGYEAVE